MSSGPVQSPIVNTVSLSCGQAVELAAITPSGRAEGPQIYGGRDGRAGPTPSPRAGKGGGRPQVFPTPTRAPRGGAAEGPAAPPPTGKDGEPGDPTDPAGLSGCICWVPRL